MRNHFVLHVSGDLAPIARRVLQAYGVTRLAACMEEVTAQGVSRKVAGVLVQWPGHHHASTMGRELKALRNQRPLLPVSALLLPACLDAPTLADFVSLDIECLVLPLKSWLLHRFAQRSLVFGALPDQALAGWVSHVARIRNLTPREVQLWAMAIQHLSRARMRRTLGVSENTLKTQVRGLLRKVGERSLDALAKNALRTALLEARPGTRDLFRAPWLPDPGMAGPKGPPGNKRNV